MKKNRNFALKMLMLVLCAAISTSVFYVPNGAEVSAADNTELRGGLGIDGCEYRLSEHSDN